jgi:antitoxin (DNA-binding transcriptional repressor) of toxin-antitoxin stability system
MKTLPVGEFKAQFSDALAEVRRGHAVGVSFGRRGRLVAVLVPPEALADGAGVKLGLLAKSAKIRIKRGFKMSEDDLLRA